MKFLLLLYAFFLLSLDCFSQTCVIARITMEGKDTSIAIGADTKFGIYTFNHKTNTIDTTFRHGHKIFNRGKITYVTIGYGSEIQRRIADSLCSLNLRVYEIIDKYADRYEKLCMLDLADIKKRSPKMYQQMTGKSPSIISSTIFAGFSHNKPFLFHLLFILNRQSGIKCTFLDDPVAAGGELNAVQGELSNNRNWEGDPIAAIRKMLKTEAMDQPDKVGLPFDFYIIYKNRVEQHTYTHY
jgi:hypothetical protein